MLNPNLEEALNKITTVDFGKITPIQYSSDLAEMSFNGISAKEIQSLTTESIPTLTTTAITGLSSVQLSAIGGTAGYAYTTGSNLTWNTPNYNNSAVGGVTIPAGKGGQLQLKGEDADIVVNGKSMMKLLERIEERLNLLEPNTELEKDWDDLRRLGERYRRLEKKCKEKAETWKKLKAMPPPAVD